MHRCLGVLGTTVGGLLLLTMTSTAFAGAPAVAYSFNVMGIRAEVDGNYVGMYPGDDMLPYTDDDFEIESDCGNYGGTWGFAHMDHNNDGVIDEGEHYFHTVRAEDDDSTLLSTMSRPEYGVIYEGEDWMGWLASGFGPNRCNLAEATNYDFEINDWNQWNGQSNAYVYNNLGANQHGLGLPKYRVDYRTEPGEGGDWVYDEVEGYEKTFGFRNNTDDPNTAFVENGSCNRWFRAKPSLEVRGYLVPVEDLPELENGSLPSLFGWESVDLAEYFRDTIGPLVEDGSVEVWSELIGQGVPAEQLTPLTHVYLMQYEVPVDLDNGEDVCGDPAAPQQHAGYWGVGEDTVMRVSLLLGFNSRVVDDILVDALGVHPWRQAPDEGPDRNLWLQDHFWRDNPEDVGTYTTSGDPWTIHDDPTGRTLENTGDQYIRAPGAGALSAALPRPIGLAETPIVIVADLAVDGTMNEGVETEYQIIARSGNDVIAYADINGDTTQIHFGGTYDPATGVASAPTSSGEVDLGAVMSEINNELLEAEYTRFVLEIRSDGASLRQAEQADFEPRDYELIGDLDEIASAAAPAGGLAIRGGLTHVSIGGLDNTVINTLLVFASPGVGPFLRGDCNQDGNADLSDGVRLLSALFLGTANPDCLAACLNNGGSALDLSAAIYLFNFLFLGGNDLPAPAGVAGYSQNENDFRIGCDSYAP